MTTPEDRVWILKAENQRLKEYLNSLSEEAGMAQAHGTGTRITHHTGRRTHGYKKLGY